MRKKEEGRMENAGKLKYRGGAMIGLFGASWPFATLTAEKGMLTLRSLWSFQLTASQVLRLEPLGRIPFLFSGIKIVHNDPVAPGNLVFWCMGERDRKLAAVAALLNQGGAELDTHPPRPKLNRWAVAGALAIVGLIASALWLTAKYSDSYPTAMQAMYSSPEVERALGRDKTALLIGYRSLAQGRRQCDDFTFVVRGDKGVGTVKVRAETRGGIDWRITGIAEGWYSSVERSCWAEE